MKESVENPMSFLESHEQTDGDVKVQIKANVLIPRAVGCADLRDTFFSLP